MGVTRADQDKSFHFLQVGRKGPTRNLKACLQKHRNCILADKFTAAKTMAKKDTNAEERAGKRKERELRDLNCKKDPKGGNDKTSGNTPPASPRTGEIDFMKDMG